MTTSANRAWLMALQRLAGEPIQVAPRGQATAELPQQTLEVDMCRPVVTVKSRSLNYRFMAAEARWILTGDDRVATIVPYNSRLKQYSDDGDRFFGAYGPKVTSQLPYVIAKLLEDPASRQAGLTIWRESPPTTKDVPCTVAMFFQLRDGKLNCHVFMRSSDIWLGVPYDVFNFSMISCMVAASLNHARLAEAEVEMCGGHIPASAVVPGTLYLTAASSHLYERDRSLAVECLAQAVQAYSPGDPLEPPVPSRLYLAPGALLETLTGIADNGLGNRWWRFP